MIKTLFLGNHTVGVRVLQTLIRHTNVIGVVCHSPDEEDGKVYESVYDFAIQQEIDVIRGKGKDKAIQDFIHLRNPDLIWVTDFRYLIPQQVIEIPKLGSVNLHPSLLPKYRGRAPLNWAIINGEKKLGLTAHFIDDGMDSGDIIDQLSFELSEDQDVGDALKILYPLYVEITERVISKFEKGIVKGHAQNHSIASYFPARKSSDGRIDFNLSSSEIVNLIRAVAPPYPGAFGFMQNQKIYIFRAIEVENYASETPGKVIGLIDGLPIVACGRGAIILKKFNSGNSKIEVGHFLT